MVSKKVLSFYISIAGAAIILISTIINLIVRAKIVGLYLSTSTVISFIFLIAIVINSLSVKRTTKTISILNLIFLALFTVYLFIVSGSWSYADLAGCIVILAGAILGI